MTFTLSQHPVLHIPAQFQNSACRNTYEQCTDGETQKPGCFRQVDTAKLSASMNAERKSVWNTLDNHRHTEDILTLTQSEPK